MYTAFVFPGQGIQFVGMGKDLYDNFSIARDVFHEIDEIISEKLTDIIFNGPDSTLALTKYAQLSIVAVSIALVRVIEQQAARRCYNMVQYVAGHSLGEYTALYVADSLSLKQVIQILRVRANAMQEATSQSDGSMIACLGITIDELLPVLHDCSKLGVCEIANDNTVGQVVVSGHNAAIDAVAQILRNKGKKTIKLNVSGAFHSSLMAYATKVLHSAIQKIDIAPPRIPVVANYTADIVNNPLLIKDYLVKQVEGMVRWRETMNLFKEKNVQRIVEIGPGRILANLARKGNYGFDCISINSARDIERFLSAI